MGSKGRAPGGDEKLVQLIVGARAGNGTGTAGPVPTISLWTWTSHNPASRA